MMTTQMGPEGFSLLRPTRRPGTGLNRGERLLGLTSTLQSSSLEDNLEDLREEDVWPADEEHTMASEEKRKKLPHNCSNNSSSNFLSGLSVAFADPATRTHDLWLTRHRSAASMIPHIAGTTSDGRRKPVIHQSAPMNVPDWSKILGIDYTQSNASVADDDDVDEDDRLPPHEYLAREHASGQVAATSVLEGVGRTLKGRDMSRVRNAVWRHTGFLG